MSDNGERPRLAPGTVDGVFIFEPADYNTTHYQQPGKRLTKRGRWQVKHVPFFDVPHFSAPLFAAPFRLLQMFKT